MTVFHCLVECVRGLVPLSQSCFSAPKSAQRNSFPTATNISGPLPFAIVRSGLICDVALAVSLLVLLVLKMLWPGDGGTSHSGVRFMTRGIFCGGVEGGVEMEKRLNALLHLRWLDVFAARVV